MSELPKGWCSAEIGDLCELINGRAFKPQEWSDVGLPIIRIQNLNNRNASFNHFAGMLSEKHLIKKGDLLFAWSGTPGTSFGAHVWHGDDAALNQHIFKVDFDKASINRNFFLHAINQKLDELIGAAQGGVGLRHVTKGTFEKTEISFPPLAEQARIAQTLDGLLAQVDTLKARLDALPALIKRFRQSVLSAAVSGKMTEIWRKTTPASVSAKELHILLKEAHAAEGGHARGNASNPTEEAHDLHSDDVPNDWEIAELRDICAPCRPITYGILKPGPELDEGIPYIRVADFPGNTLKTANIKKTSKEIDIQFRRSRLQAGDLILSIRGSVGRVIKIPQFLDGANITQDTARLSISPLMSTDYVYLVILEQSTQRRMKNATRGVAVRGINIGDVRALQIPLPSYGEQKEIVRRVEQLFAFADQLEARLTDARARVDALTQSILAKAFRGELVPQDPADEPASALLERITAQRAAAPKPKRGRKSV